MNFSNRPYEGILICTDFDGTLSLYNDIPAQNREAIAEFCEKGGHFSISSGRDAPYLMEKAGGLFNSPLICVNGTKIYDVKTEQTILSMPMDSDAMTPLLWEGAVKPVAIEIVLENGFCEGFVPRDEILFDRYRGYPILKIVTLYQSEKDCLLAKEQLSCKFPQYHFARSFTTGLEQTAAKAGKGVCVNALKAFLGAKKTVCIGDFENDISMLEVADLAFAPRNALPEVKSIAHRTLGYAGDGAVAEMIRLLPELL